MDYFSELRIEHGTSASHAINASLPMSLAVWLILPFGF
jgi:hypothetical protein